MRARPKEKDQNQPVVVATHADPYSSHYKDLQMTRSLGDWTKSAWVLPLLVVAPDPRRAAEVQPVKTSNEPGTCRVFWHLEE